MDQAIDALQFSDFFSLLFILCIVTFAGKAMSSRTPRGYDYAARVGYIVFLAYATLALFHFGLSDLSMVAAVLIRALTLAGIAYGAACCIMPAFLIIRDKHRALRDRHERQRTDRVRRKSNEQNERLRREAERQDAERRRLRAEADAKHRGEYEARQRVEQERRHNERSRSSQARSRCELLFSLYKADIESRFTRDMLDDFMTKYMGETEPAETVERRAEELCGILERHRELVLGKVQPTTIVDLAKWFSEQQQLIEQSPAPADLKENQVVMLSMRYEKLFEEIMRKAEP